MNLSDPHCKIKLVAAVSPPSDSVDTRGKVLLGGESEINISAAVAAWTARIIFGAAAQTATVDLYTGSITPSAVGTLQVERGFVTASGGCTADGTLNLTITGAGIAGSPLSVPVPLTTREHTTAAAIATAIRNALLATVAVRNVFDVTSESSLIFLTRKFAAANDTTLNLAIPAGLGVTAAPTSTNIAAGVAGVVVQRLGGDAKDLYGKALPSPINPMVVQLTSPQTQGVYTSSEKMGVIQPGQTKLVASDTSLNMSDFLLTASSSGQIDLVVMGK